jgi:integrase
MSIRVPKYRHHKASGLALVEIRGRHYYLGKYDSPESHEQYRRLITQHFSDNPVLAEPSTKTSISVDALILNYFRFAKTYYVKNGELTPEITSLRIVLRRLRKQYGRTDADEFGPKALKIVRESMIQEGLSRRYINESINRIRRMFKWGVAEELIPAPVHQALATVPGLRRGRSAARETDKILPVSDEIVEATLPHLGTVVQAMIRLQRLTGMRPAEVCILRPKDIDRSGEIWIYTPSRHKTEHADKQRAVPLGPNSQRILTPYLKRDDDDYCFRPCDSERKRRAKLHARRKTPLQQGNRPGTKCAASPLRKAGECYTTASFRRAIHRACDKAFPHPELAKENLSKLDEHQCQVLREWQSQNRWSPNQLRHASATEIRHKYGLEAAQVVLGHSQANVTQVYAARDLTKALEVAKLIG